MSELELVPTDALVAELFRRYDVALFAGLKLGTRAGVHEYHRRWLGNVHTVAGLAQDVAMTAIVGLHREAVAEQPSSDRVDDDPLA